MLIKIIKEEIELKTKKNTIDFPHLEHQRNKFQLSAGTDPVSFLLTFYFIVACSNYPTFALIILHCYFHLQVLYSKYST